MENALAAADVAAAPYGTDDVHHGREQTRRDTSPAVRTGQLSASGLQMAVMVLALIPVAVDSPVRPAALQEGHAHRSG
ncbi:hypothetical protein GCM10010344_09090 [Streptomyces bluensis]|nr:hypothetical protein GCM10010344_09090 [Streptomyces bluensis]